MKFPILMALLLLTGPACAGSTLAFLYGRGVLEDGAKDSENAEPKGPSYKILFGEKGDKIFQFDVMLRYSDLTEDIKYQSTKGKLHHRQFGYGVQLGAWIVPWLQPHFGYARHALIESSSGEFTELQKLEIIKNFNLRQKTTAGLYGGVDFGIISSKHLQLFANYDYYHYNGLKTHEWEVMAGLRIFFEGSVGSGKLSSSLINSLAR